MLQFSSQPPIFTLITFHYFNTLIYRDEWILK